MAKLARGEFVVIKVVRIITAVAYGISILAPAGFVIGAALGTRERVAGDFFAASGANFGSGRSAFGHGRAVGSYSYS